MNLKYSMGVTMKKKFIFFLAGVVALSSLAACAGNSDTDVTNVDVTTDETTSNELETNESTEGEAETVEDWTVSYEGITKGTINAGVSVHDPSIYQENGIYYIFGSHMASAKSEDGRVWQYIGNGYKEDNPVYSNLWSEDLNVFAYAGEATSVIPTDDGGSHVWAPDVIYNDVMGCYMMYYCTSSTWNASNICFATSDSIEGPYTWQDAIIYSGFSKSNVDATNVLDYWSEDKVEASYSYNTYPNAIDPTIFFDEDHRLWMVYGSWSGGIYLIEIDASTGYPIHPEEDKENNVDAYFGKKLLGGFHTSIEGPYILYDEASGYYYLFVSYGSLTREGGYQIRVFRSKTVDGEYVDMNGAYPWNDTVHNKYGLKLSGNYRLPSLSKAYMATGHNSACINDKGQYILCYHTRFEGTTENHEPRIKQFFMNKEGWPCVLPYCYDDEEISKTGYSLDEMVGTYYFINQGIAINSSIAEPSMMRLNADGTISGEQFEGTWTYEEGSYYMTLTYNDTLKEQHTYSGIFCKQKDEAGSDVIVFSAVGENKSIWGVKYTE